MLSLNDVSVDLDGKRIIDQVSLAVARQEILAILGPSGSGKTTLLRAIAGLEPIAAGTITWDGEDLAGVPVHKRGFGMMFQGFALFPHLTVAGNVGFGLKPELRAVRTGKALEMVGLSGFEDREISDLSGGEKQRVALARTLAPEPGLIMLDEPMGSLDRSLRERLVADTRELLMTTGITAIVVTHDRDEAVKMSDRLALMREGRIVQTGRLEEILADPGDDWVGSFLG